MNTRQEIETAIARLPESDVRDLAQWLQEYLDDRWDRQLETDLKAGKLDKLIARVEADIANHNTRDLDGIFRDG